MNQERIIEAGITRTKDVLGEENSSFLHHTAAAADSRKVASRGIPGAAGESFCGGPVKVAQFMQWQHGPARDLFGTVVYIGL